MTSVYRDTAHIADSRVHDVVQPDGSVAYFFGNTTIVARKKSINGSFQLEPLRGDQVSCGEWYDLPNEEVSAYCKLLETFINVDKRPG